MAGILSLPPNQVTMAILLPQAPRMPSPAHTARLGQDIRVATVARTGNLLRLPPKVMDPTVVTIPVDRGRPTRVVRLPVGSHRRTVRMAMPATVIQAPAATVVQLGRQVTEMAVLPGATAMVAHLIAAVVVAHSTTQVEAANARQSPWRSLPVAARRFRWAGDSARNRQYFYFVVCSRLCSRTHKCLAFPHLACCVLAHREVDNTAELVTPWICTPACGLRVACNLAELRHSEIRWVPTPSGPHGLPQL